MAGVTHVGIQRLHAVLAQQVGRHVDEHRRLVGEQGVQRRQRRARRVQHLVLDAGGRHGRGEVVGGTLLAGDQQHAGRSVDLHRGAADVVLGHGRGAGHQPDLVADRAGRLGLARDDHLGAPGLGGDGAAVDLVAVGGRDDLDLHGLAPGVAQDADDLVGLAVADTVRGADLLHQHVHGGAATDRDDVDVDAGLGQLGGRRDRVAARLATVSEEDDPATLLAPEHAL